MNGELNENESKPEEKNLFEKAVDKTVDLSENKTLKAFGIWWRYILGMIVIFLTLFAYFYGTTKNKIDSSVIEKANEFGLAFKHYRGVIKDANGNIITTATCKLRYSDQIELIENDTIEFTGYYHFKVPSNAHSLELKVWKRIEDLQKAPNTKELTEKDVDIIKTIICR